MRILLLFAVLLSAHAYAADWMEVGVTPEARILLDQESVESSGGEHKASLKFQYHKEQPGQTITQGRPFDSSINRYFLDCGSQKYQVLDLILYHKNGVVGSFHADLNPDNLDRVKLGTGPMFLVGELCAADKTHAAGLK